MESVITTILAIVLLASTSSASVLLFPDGVPAAPVEGCHESDLHAAIRSGNLDSVRRVISTADLYQENCRGLTPMHIAILKDNINLIVILVEYQFDVKRLFNRGKSLLHFAVANNAKDAARKLIDFRCPVDSIDEDGTTPLEIAITLDNVDMLTMLERAGADVKRTSKHGNSYAEIAVRSHASKSLDRLLRLGVPVEENRPGRTPLMRLALIANDVQSMEVLRNNGVNTNIKSEIGGRTMLHEAVYLGYYEAVVWLLSTGVVNVNSIDRYLQTPLHMAVRRGTEKVIKEIISCQANINPQDIWGKTPLHYAKEKGYTDIANLLINLGGKDL